MSNKHLSITYPEPDLNSFLSSAFTSFYTISWMTLPFPRCSGWKIWTPIFLSLLHLFLWSALFPPLHLLHLPPSLLYSSLSLSLPSLPLPFFLSISTPSLPPSILSSSPFSFFPSFSPHVYFINKSFWLSDSYFLPTPAPLPLPPPPRLLALF